jgi:hypothetical protein
MCVKRRSTRKMKKRPKLGKKAFIASFIVDFWAYLAFVLVVIVFALIFKLATANQTRALEDAQDIIYGNYISNVYLRTPVLVGGERITMAELISMYDYNQTLEKEKAKAEEVGKSRIEIFIEDVFFFYGQKDNPMWRGIATITEEFIKDSLDARRSKGIAKYFGSGRCYVLAIKGNGFEYSRFGSFCPTKKPFSIATILPQIGVPEESFITYLPSVDPREDPIEVYVIYDLARLVDIYASEKYQSMSYWQRRSTAAFCYVHPEIPNCINMWEDFHAD